MARHADRLADIGREGFDLLDRFYGGGASNRGPKKQYNAPQQYAPVPSNEKYNAPLQYATKYNAPQHHAPVPSNENIIDCKKAAEKYKGVVIMEHCKKRFVGWRF
ncbi:hypothetical protein ACJRO7_032457 [Eucalyptus globulus]|uniref:Uncharacterized protein n=1 Tax=Eucalyptus globulus TaxID=34317 RepID=A0ABD3JQR2_EUCGL